MRAPFQILAIPYKIINSSPLYCVFHRADFDQWQFIAGGGEDDESPVQAAKREISEEGGVIASQYGFTAHCGDKHHFHSRQLDVGREQIDIFLVMQNTALRV